MSGSFEKLLELVRACSDVQKAWIFREIRSSIAIHEIEKLFNVKAEVILEAIGRATDLTQRGVRGIIAETIFAVDIAPAVKGWKNDPPVGDVAYDVCLYKGKRRVRIQVKMQRKEKGQPKRNKVGQYIVEVQRTRGGTDKRGNKTRPYRFGEFDLLAVCMEPSTKEWTAFMYAWARDLEPSPDDKKIIRTFQAVPPFPGHGNGIWTSDLATALEKWS
jgi:hypothetical protein